MNVWKRELSLEAGMSFHRPQPELLILDKKQNNLID